MMPILNNDGLHRASHAADVQWHRFNHAHQDGECPDASLIRAAAAELYDLEQQVQAKVKEITLRHGLTDWGGTIAIFSMRPAPH
jgi:hypothetical protein